MNAQSNHPINDTTDPLFLGPEAGQQADGKEGGSARDVQAHELGDMRTILHIALTQPGVMNQAYRAFHNYSIGNQLLPRCSCWTRACRWRPSPASMLGARRAVS